MAADAVAVVAAVSDAAAVVAAAVAAAAVVFLFPWKSRSARGARQSVAALHCRPPASYQLHEEVR